METMKQRVKSHGLLGQTWKVKNKNKSSHNQWNLDGEVDDYLVEDGLFGSEFPFNKFGL